MRFPLFKATLMVALGLPLVGCKTLDKDTIYLEGDARAQNITASYPVSERVTLVGSYAYHDGADGNTDMTTELIHGTAFYALRKGEKWTVDIGAGLRVSDNSVVIGPVHDRSHGDVTHTDLIASFATEWRVIKPLGLRFQYNEAVGANAPDTFFGVRVYPWKGLHIEYGKASYDLRSKGFGFTSLPHCKSGPGNCGYTREITNMVDYQLHSDMLGIGYSF